MGDIHGYTPTPLLKTNEMSERNKCENQCDAWKRSGGRLDLELRLGLAGGVDGTESDVVGAEGIDFETEVVEQGLMNLLLRQREEPESVWTWYRRPRAAMIRPG